MTERTIFLTALDKTDPGQRATYLDAACGGDAPLRHRIEALLRSHEQAGSFLAAPLLPDRPTDAETEEAEEVCAQPCEGPGSRVGLFKLLEPLGEGGMGVVFVAEQVAPVRRKVAVKLIKPGMDSKQVVARFEAERQALALMDHPNIARVLDAGTTPGGRPYFVMELFKGVPITRFSDEYRLTLRQRLELFVSVCEAVQHAHQKGVIHRDLKPSNVLVAHCDGRAVPKVIDFGVAKATTEQLTEKTLVTGLGAVVGTLEYMSPEQATLNQLDIDTRSDIYALGAILYELLCGATPLDRKRLHESALLAVLRMIREEEPPRPSVRLSSTDDLTRIAADRGLDAKKLRKLVQGELDWIVMKCLEKDRSRRYESATGLAQDARRYLADEPVTACPPSALYRLGKFARRNQVVLTATALVALALVAATAFSAWQAVRATYAEKIAKQDRDRAQTAEGKAASEAQRAQQQAAEAEAQRQLVEQYLRLALIVAEDKESIRPLTEKVFQRGRDQEALLRIAQRIVKTNPANEEGWKLLSVAYDAAGKHEEALGHFSQAVKERLRSAPANNRLAWFLVMCPEVSLRDPRRAVAYAEKAVEVEAKVPWYWNTLGVAHYRAGDLRAAIEVLKKSESMGWDDGFNSYFLAMAHWELGDRGEARRRFALAVEREKPALPFCATELGRMRKEAERLMKE